MTAYDHRQLPVERTINTWKNHLTSCLHGADKHFPAHLWCHTINQDNTQVNLLQQSRINPCQSAYAELFGQCDFNAFPLVSIGTEAIIFQPQTNQTTSYSDHRKKWMVYRALSGKVSKLQSLPDSNKRSTTEPPR